MGTGFFFGRFLLPSFAIPHRPLLITDREVRQAGPAGTLSQTRFIVGI